MERAMFRSFGSGTPGGQTGAAAMCRSNVSRERGRP